MTNVDPIELFERWLADARAARIALPEAMALATADADGSPDARMVILHSVDRSGLVFFTDRASTKGAHLRANPRAALLVFWRELGRQVRIAGMVTETSLAEDEEAFSGRPRDVQIAVAAWRQGDPILDPDKLRVAFNDVEKRFQDGQVPRPARWGGYRLVPERFLFWQEHPARRHHRERYVRDANGTWLRILLAP